MALSVDIEKQLGSFRLRVKFESGDSSMSLLGASGCGKSMTLKCIAGIEHPDKGRIVLNDRVLFDSDQHIDLSVQKREVGYLFQQGALFPNMNVKQNIICGFRQKLSRNERDRAVADMIAAMHLEGMENKKPHQLSGGQQQRVALARILVNDPQALLLDEPFSALDSHLRFELEREVMEIIRKLGKPAILVSHNRDEAFRITENIAIMNDGAIEAFGSRHEVFANPVTRSGAILTGCKNVAECRKLEDGLYEVADWGVKLRTAAPADKDYKYIGIRMHDIHLGPGSNEMEVEAAEVIENPFSYTVIVKPTGRKDISGIGVELEKDQWDKMEHGRFTVHVEPEAILMLV